MLKDQVTITSKHEGQSTENTMGKTFTFDLWTVNLYKDGEQFMQTPFMMGEGHNGGEPTRNMVLASLVMDGQMYLNCNNLDDFVSETGQVDRDKASEQYSACGKAYKLITKAFGEQGFSKLSEELADY